MVVYSKLISEFSKPVKKNAETIDFTGLLKTIKYQKNREAEKYLKYLFYKQLVINILTIY